MARRDGQIIARGERRWLVRWHLGQDPQTGKYRYRSKLVRGTKKDAQRVLNGVLRSQDMGTYAEPTRMTLAVFLDRWLAAATSRVSERTLSDYRYLLKQYVRPTLGHQRLDALRPLDVQGLIADLEARPAGKRGKLTPRTIRSAVIILGAALEQAVRWGLIPTNPRTQVDLPRRQQREMRALSAEEVAEFRKHARGTKHEALFDFLLATGCRPGEALAVRWADLDLEQGVVTIRQALSVVGTRLVFKAPKTAKSRRMIPLPPVLVRALQSHRKTQAEQMLKVGPGYARDLDLIFANEVGQPLDPRNLSQRHFRKIVEMAKLPASLRLYDFRHTCATLALKAGLNVKVVSERLGHASAAMTLDVYSHVLPGMQEEATRRLGAVIFGSSRTPPAHRAR